MDKFIGIDLGGTKITVVIADYSGTLISSHKTFTPKTSTEKTAPILEAIYKSIEVVQEMSGISWEQINEIGISCPGLVDSRKGITYNPVNLPGWKKVYIKKIFQEKYNKKVILENDANAAALAEKYFGAGQKYNNLVYITMSTGIGGGIIIDGKLVRGAHFSAGEIGHIKLVPDGGPLCACGKNGCFEAFCSGTAIARRMREIANDKTDIAWLRKAGRNKEKLAPPILLESALKNDPLSLKLLEEVGYYLGLGCANIANMFDPDIIILGTLVIHFKELLLVPARKSFLNHISYTVHGPNIMIPAQLKEKLSEMAAISVIIHHHITNK